MKRNFLRWIGRLWLRLFGWDVVGGVPTVPKAVVVAYPHTSNWDFPFALAIAFAHGIDMRWMGKKNMFRWPFGGFMRWLGGIPVDRSRHTRLVDAVAEILREADDLFVVLPPEGTRGAAGRWKSGFYWIAVAAEVPIVLSFLDFPRKRGGVGETFFPTGDIDADIVRIREFYQGIEGRYPEKQKAISLVDSSARPEGSQRPS